jgi:hypothetical protein
MDFRGFAPHYGRTVAMTCTATETTVAFPNAQGGGSSSILLTNIGTQTVFFRASVSSDATAATAGDVPIPAGGSRVLYFGYRDAPFTFHAIAPAGAGSILYVTPGMGGN